MLKRWVGALILAIVTLPMVATSALADGGPFSGWYFAHNGLTVEECGTEISTCSSYTSTTALVLKVTLPEINPNGSGNPAWYMLKMTGSCTNSEGWMANASLGSSTWTPSIDASCDILIGYRYSATSPTNYDTSIEVAHIVADTSPVSPITGGTNDPPPVDPDYDVSDGNCHFSVNPVRWMRCLWEPSEGSLEGWSDRIDSIKTKPPISLIIGGLDFVNVYLQSLECAAELGDQSLVGSYFSGGFGGCTGGSSVIGSSTIGIDGVGTSVGELLDSAGDIVGGNSQSLFYRFVVYGLWIFFFFAAWHIIGGAFGDNSGSMASGGVE